MKNTTKNLLTGLFAGLLLASASTLSHAALWQDAADTVQHELRGMSVTPVTTVKHNQVQRFAAARLLDLNLTELQEYLVQAPTVGSTSTAPVIELPLPHGEFAEFLIYTSPVMPPALAAKFPTITTYKVIERENPANSGRVDLTPEGFHAVLNYYGETVYIDPLGSANQYQSYFKRDYASAKLAAGIQQNFQCDTNNHAFMPKVTSPSALRYGALPAEELSFGTQLTTFRIAVAVTGEFTRFHGGTKASGLAALVTGLNRVNEIYERDLAIRLELVTDNDKIIYTDPYTDPFDPNSSTVLAVQVVDVIDQEIGSANFDVGHVIHGEGIGGIAAYASACDDYQKAMGETASDQPINDPFFIDFVAHELGHQFGATHSFNATSGSCSGNRIADNAYEPGSGSTVMGYAGICGDESLQLNSDFYFHSDSIQQIRNHLAGSGGCGVASGALNSVPTSDAGSANSVHYIPVNTPFMLSGSGTDLDGDRLTYSWEQLDLGPATSSRADQVDDGQRPLFRSFTPSVGASRTFPRLADVLTGSTRYGELLPTTGRALNFRLTVRDGKGGVASAKRTLQVVASAGPFVLTLPNNTNWQASNQTLSWDVANTNVAPLSCATVDIELSADGGYSFPIMLAQATPNDGSEAVTLPALSTSSGRVRLSCTTQPFFALNSSDITIQTSGPGVKLQVRATLQGAYAASDGLMRADLSAQGLLPVAQPYNVQNLSGSTALSTTVAALPGEDAPVDWVLVELLDAADRTRRIATMAAIIQRDGDIVDAQTGAQTLIFPEAMSGNYYIGLRHRNHLGVISADRVALSDTTQSVDFSSTAFSVYGRDARYINSTLAMLWGGEADNNNSIISNGPSSDVTQLLSTVLTSPNNTSYSANYRLDTYSALDFNLDGAVIFVGPGNDSLIPVSNVLLHPQNSTAAANFIVNGQKP